MLIYPNGQYSSWNILFHAQLGVLKNPTKVLFWQSVPVNYLKGLDIIFNIKYLINSLSLCEYTIGTYFSVNNWWHRYNMKVCKVVIPCVKMKYMNWME